MNDITVMVTVKQKLKDYPINAYRWNAHLIYKSMLFFVLTFEERVLDSKHIKLERSINVSYLELLKYRLKCQHLEFHNLQVVVRLLELKLHQDV